MSAAHVAPLLLYAEDELIIQQDVAAALAEAGFDVLIASDGTEALAFLESRASELRALITDGELGQGPDGWDLARRARAS